jgi:hypothetical protein
MKFGKTVVDPLPCGEIEEFQGTTSYSKYITRISCKKELSTSTGFS